MSTARHLEQFGVTEGTLAVGGVPLHRLTARVGATPFFAYDRSLISRRVGEVRAALPDGMALSYAVKANPMPAVVHHLRGLVDAFDVASSREMSVVLDAGMPADHVSFAGPGKTEAELAQAVAAGVTIEMESVGEARRLAKIGDASGTTPRVAIRVNPDFQIKGSGMRMGGGPQQFGIDAESVPQAIAEAESLGLDLLGFHVFAGSQNLHADILTEAQTKTVELVLSLAQHASRPLQYVNLGGGFGIPYFEKDTPLDLDAVGHHLGDLYDRVLAPALPQAQVTIELGRYLVGEAGVYVTRVVDRKVSRGKTFLVVDGGLHHQLAASGNFGQVLRRNYPVTVADQSYGSPTEVVSVVGCLCTPLDLLGDNVTLPASDVGDLVVLFQAGAYGRTASPADFLSHPEAPEVLV
jgi:diaminopimelate decarboxylase